MVRRFAVIKIANFVAFSALCGSSLSANVPSEALLHDAQCFIATASLSESDDEIKRVAGIMGSMFFSGKIFGADPAIDLKRLLKTAAKGVDQVSMDGLLRECGEELKLRGSQLQDTGNAILEEELGARTGGSRQ